MGLPQHRVVAEVEARSVDNAGALGLGDELASLGDRHGERLLANDVLARLEEGLDVLKVQVVWAGDVNDVDGTVVTKGVEAVIDMGPG